MPQGFFEKIKIQLLLADLAFQIGDPPPCRHQITRFLRRILRGCRINKLRQNRAAASVAQSPLPAGTKRVAPAVQQWTLYIQFAPKGRHVLTGLHALHDFQLEFPAETAGLLGRKHQSSLQRTVTCFTDSFTGFSPSLSPVHTVGNQIDEALYLHRDVTRKECRELTEQMLALVGFPNPTRAYDMYSMELSGGLRQRAMIAMALVCNPALLIADEPTTALDVTVQAQVLAVLKDVQRKLGMSLLLITHDLGVVANMADEVIVLYHGNLMEAGTLDDIFHRAEHPYLKALLAAVPRLDMQPGERLVALREITQDLPQSFKERAKERLHSPEDRLLTLRNVTKSFESKKGSMLVSSASNRVIAVDNVSFSIRYGECFGLVGRTFPCLIPCPRRLAHSLFFRNKRSSGLLFGAI